LGEVPHRGGGEQKFKFKNTPPRQETCHPSPPKADCQRGEF